MTLCLDHYRISEKAAIFEELTVVSWTDVFG